MRFVVALGWIVFAGSPAFALPPDTPIRTIELVLFSDRKLSLSMEQTDRRDTPSALHGGSEGVSKHFKVYDIGWRSGQPGRPGVVDLADIPANNALAMTGLPSTFPTSALAVPAWMQASHGPALLGPGASCPLSVYRPTGLLGLRAESRRAAHYSQMHQAACQYGLPVNLFDAMIIRESRYEAQALSPKNAYGLTQLLAGTAEQLGINRYDPAQNLLGGARYLREQIDRFGEVHLALAAYNAGPGRIRNGQMPRIVETVTYVADILRYWQRISSLHDPIPGSGQPAAAFNVQAILSHRPVVTVTTF